MRRFRYKPNGTVCTAVQIKDIKPEELDHFNLTRDQYGVKLKENLGPLPIHPDYFPDEYWAVCFDSPTIASAVYGPGFFHFYFEPIGSETQSVRKPFTTAEVRDIMDQLFSEKITYSKMVEMLNAHVYSWLEKNKSSLLVDN